MKRLWIEACIAANFWGHRPSTLAAERDWLLGVLAALSERLATEQGVRADTAMLSRFFRREGTG